MGTVLETSIVNVQHELVTNVWEVLISKREGQRHDQLEGNKAQFSARTHKHTITFGSKLFPAFLARDGTAFINKHIYVYSGALIVRTFRYRDLVRIPRTEITFKFIPIEPANSACDIYGREMCIYLNNVL